MWHWFLRFSVLVSLTVTGARLKSRWLSGIQGTGRRQCKAWQFWHEPGFGNHVFQAYWVLAAERAGPRFLILPEAGGQFWHLAYGPFLPQSVHDIILTDIFLATCHVSGTV